MAITFTLGLNEEQRDFATEYIRHARTRDPDEIQAGFEIERWDCGEVLLYIVNTTEDERIRETMFTPQELRDFCREVGHHWHEHGKLGEAEMNALNYIQLAADYADGNITKKEMSEFQEDFEDSHGFVRSGLKTLQFRKREEEANA